MKNTLFAMALCATFMPSAQAANVDEKALIELAQATVQEYKIYATCTATDEFAYHFLKDDWDTLRKAAVAQLSAANATTLFITKFAFVTEYVNVLDESITLKEAVSFCHKNKAQLKRFYEFKQTRLDVETSKILNKQ